MANTDLHQVKGNDSGWQQLSSSWTHYDFLSVIEGLEEGVYLICLTACLKVADGPEAARGALFIDEGAGYAEVAEGQAVLAAPTGFSAGDSVYGTVSQFWTHEVPAEECHWFDFRFKEDGAAGNAYVHKGPLTGWWIMKINDDLGGAPTCR